MFLTNFRQPEMALIEIRNLCKTFALGESIFGGSIKGEVHAVDDVSLNIEAGKCIVLRHGAIPESELAEFLH